MIKRREGREGRKRQQGDSKVGAAKALSLAWSLRVGFFRDERDAETKETTGRQQGLCVNHVVAK